MAACASCGSENPDTSRFCGTCGTAIGGVPCAACGTVNPPDHRFCGSCGRAVSPDAVPARAVDERKLATVLFADVVGFTSLAERTDHETVARSVDAAFRRLGEVVADHGGTVDKYMGDSLMAVFGVPAAHDDDAERAVAAGLAMRELGGDLAFSIGINSGEVSVTSLGREGEVTVIGDTVNVAARLEKAAGPGEVLVGTLTARLAGDRMVFRERQPVLLKGKREPVEVCEAVALREAGDRGDWQAALPTLVGRDGELAFLRSQWQRTVRERRAQVVLLTGEAGVGTTRLADELCTEVACDALVVRSAYPAYGAMGGTRVAADVARQLGPLGDEEIDARVRSAAGELDPSLRAIDPTAVRSEQIWAFRRLLEHKAAERPVLLVLDDMHRSGDKSLELMDELVERVADIPVMLVLVGRPEPSAWLSRFPSATTLRLSPLGRDEAVALALDLVDDPPLDDEALHFFVERSGGNALFLRELVAVALEQGQLVVGDGGRRLVSPGAVPPSLQAVLAARLDALDPDHKLAVQHVAVLGHAATTEQVEALGLAGADTVLRSLVAAGLLRRQGGEDAYDVADPLLGEVAYETLPRQVRVERHRLVAERAGGSEERARHLARASSHIPDDAELRAEASRALAAAGLEVLDAHRYNDGIRLLQQAMAIGEEQPRTLLRLAEALGTVGEHDEAMAVLDRLGPDTGDPRIEAERVHQRASSVVFRAPAESLAGFEEARERWAAVGDLVKEGWACSNKGVALFSLSRMDEASHALREGLVRFEQAGDRGGQLAAHSFLALIHPTDPDVPKWLIKGLRWAEETGDRSRQMGQLVSLSWHQALSSRMGGRPEIEEAEGHARRLVELGGELGSREFLIHGLSLATNLNRLAGRFDEADALADELRRAVPGDRSSAGALGRAVLFDMETACAGRPGPVPDLGESPDPVVSAGAVIVGEALTLSGRAEDAVRFLEQQASRPAISELHGVLPGLSVGLAMTLGGRPELAPPWLEGSVSTSGRMRSRAGLTAAHALLAEVRALEGDMDGARGELDQVPSPAAGGLAGALLLRARAVLGDDVAAEDLALAAVELRAPGIALP